jgi:hypothetical protein
MAIARRAADLAVMLSRSGVPVTSGAMSGNGVVRVADGPLLEQQGHAQLIGRAVVVILRTVDFPTLRPGNSITVASVVYQIVCTLAGIDGQITRVVCATQV